MPAALDWEGGTEEGKSRRKLKKFRLVLESLGWKNNFKIMKSKYSLSKGLQLSHVHKCHINTSLKYLFWWWLYHLAGQHVPMPNHPFHKEILHTENCVWLHTGLPKNRNSDHMTKSVVQTLIKLQQAWCCGCFPEEPVSECNRPLGEEPLPDIQPEPPLS